MSEDARGLKRHRILYIANPGSDSEGSQDDPTRNSTRRLIPLPLTTNLPSSHVSHHSSSHPSLSSPSSTSSPAAEESTPPPSTPGLPIPPVDLSSDGPHEPQIAYHNNDRNITDTPQITMPSRKGKFLQSLKSPFQNHNRNQRPTIDTPPKRPRTVRCVNLVVNLIHRVLFFSRRRPPLLIHPTPLPLYPRKSLLS